MNKKEAIKIIKVGLERYIETCISDDYKAEIQQEVNEALEILINKKDKKLTSIPKKFSSWAEKQR